MRAIKMIKDQLVLTLQRNFKSQKVSEVKTSSLVTSCDNEVFFDKI